MFNNVQLYHVGQFNCWWNWSTIENAQITVRAVFTILVPLSIQSCRSCYATLHLLVRDSSAVWLLLWICCRHGTSEGYTYGKQRSCLTNAGSAHFHVLWLSNFIFYHKPLYKLLHQSFFYSFITILPSESGVTLHYSTILP
jgi:hypothetical protein